MRTFSVNGRDYYALICLSNHDDIEAMEVVEVDARNEGTLLEFRMDADSARLSFIGREVEIPLLRASIEIFKEEFLDPRQAAGLPNPPW
ncbi:hypothetical protein [Embleya sp. NPDC001921]